MGNQLFAKSSDNNDTQKIRHSGDYYGPFYIAIYGDLGVGKTSVTTSFADNIYNDYSGNIMGTKIIVLDGVKIKLIIFDTAGEQQYKIRNHSNKIHGYMILYDVTNRKSFDNIGKWLAQIRERGNYDNCIVYMIGNKNDLGDKREISVEEGKKFAASNGLMFFETSVKMPISCRPCIQEGVSVEGCFMSMVSNIMVYNGSLFSLQGQ